MNKMSSKIITGKYILALLFVFAVSFQQVEAQRMQHNASKGAVAKPAAKTNKSINGGSVKSANRPGPAAGKTGNAVKNNNGSKTTAENKKVIAGNKVNTGDKNIKAGNKTNVGNSVNIDNSKKNVNINVDNSKDVNIHNNRNTVVRHNNYRPYTRPPYVYGGRRYYCYHPYHYHPYRPFFWGPVWHPWGFFVTTIATTAIIISIESQQYHYDQGVYYVAVDGGYTVVQAPVGATITTLPTNSQTVVINETTNNYYYGGTYYEKSDGGYTVVPPTAGTVVENLPEGGEEVKIGDVTYVKFGETYYQPIDQDGKSMYEVVQIEIGEE
jgi:ribosomal 50S subunit-recycling heat shock protein